MIYKFGSNKFHKLLVYCQECELSFNFTFASLQLVISLNFESSAPWWMREVNCYSDAGKHAVIIFIYIFFNS